jgi:medium-chain acyl-[acyl-carrier-protein] hydrolase
MGEIKPVWTDAYQVRAAEVDASGRLSPVALGNFLQETAGNHAAHLGWSIERLLADGLTWVLARLHVDIRQTPRWRDELRISTWPSGSLRAYAVREFRITDDTGAERGVGTSGWLLVDARSRRPRRPPQEVAEIAALAPPRTLDDRFERLPELPTCEGAHRIVASFLDHDLNDHVNNVTLVRWALEATPEALLRAHELAALEVEFRGECLAGETVDASAAPLSADGLTWGHCLLRGSDGRESALLRTRWRPRT